MGSSKMGFPFGMKLGDIDLAGVGKKLGDDINSSVNNAKQALGDAAGKMGDVLKKDEKRGEPIRIKKDFVKLLYYLAVSDEKFQENEKKSFEEFGCELDSDFETYKETLIKKCDEQIRTCEKEYGYFNAVKLGAQKVLQELGSQPGITMQDKKLLCWDLLTIAGLDGFEDSELDFIRFTSEKIGVEPAILLEMQNYYKAVIALDNELEWLKPSMRPYCEIAPVVNELGKRRLEITDAIHDLIQDA